MTGGRLLAFAGVVVVILGLVGVVLVFREGVRFVPSHGHYSAVAIRSTPDGEIEALYAPCDDPEWQDKTPFRRMLVTEFRLDVGELAGEDERDWETIWRLTLDEATDIDSVILGELPEGGTEEIPWPDDGVDGFSADALFSALFTVEGGPEDGTRTGTRTKEIESFRLDDLDDGTVRFRDENMTPEEFAQADRCTD